MSEPATRSRQARTPGRHWFRVRWTPGQDSAELIIAIPGYRYDVTRHASPEEADTAAQVIYDQYLTDMSTIKNPAQNAG